MSTLRVDTLEDIAGTVSIDVVDLVSGSGTEGLSDTTDLTKGAALIGRNIQMVTNVTQLKQLSSSSPSKFAMTLGYYTAGDGGGAIYRYDSTDTSSADNNGTILVANDSARWKMVVRGPIRAKQFGVVGDGVTDDAARLNQWAAVLASGEGYWDAGTYLVGTTITFPINSRITGAGIGTTTVVRAGTMSTSSPIIKMPLTGGCTLAELTVNGNNVSHSTSEIDMGATSGLKNILSRVRLINPMNIGVSVGGAARIENCVMIGPTSATVGGTFGVWADSTAFQANLEVTGSIFQGWRLNGVFMGGISTISNCTFNNNHLQTSPTGGGQVNSGVTLNKATIYGCRFTGATGASTSGIEIDHSPHLISNNHFDNHPLNAIIIQSGAGHVITNNNIQGTAGTNVGVRVNAGLGQFVIGNNIIYGYGTGILVSAGASFDYTITGNVLLGNTVFISDGGTGSNKAVANNSRS